MITTAQDSRKALRLRGFSLLELLITMAILVVVTTLMWSRTSGKYQRGKEEQCRDNLQKCFIALQAYANDHSGSLPDVAGAKTSEEPLALLVPRATVDTSIFICPGTRDEQLPSGEPFAGRKISYAFYMNRKLTDAAAALMSDAQVDTSAKTPGQQLFSDTGEGPGSNHSKYGGNVLFADGRAESSPAKSAFPLALTNGVVLLNPKP